MNKELLIETMKLWIKELDIQESELFEPAEEVITEDIILGDNFTAFRVANPNTREYNSVFLMRTNVRIPGQNNVLQQETMWIATIPGVNPNDYEYKIIATKK